MGNWIDSDVKTLEEYSRHVQNSYMRIRVRFVGTKNRLIVDVWEYTRQRTSKARSLAVARECVGKHAIVNADNVILLDHEIEKKVGTHDGSKRLIHIRQLSFAFDAVDDNPSFLKI